MPNGPLYLNRRLPPELHDLTELALDLRWTTSVLTRNLWYRLDPVTWERSENPFLILINVPQERLEEAARDPEFLAELAWCRDKRTDYVRQSGWFSESFPSTSLRNVAYFSMEFGLSEALPIYSGGLGMLAGDHLKSASDLGVPLVGVGLLYQQGYFRQVLGEECEQLEAFPYNDPSSLPVRPVLGADGHWLRIPLALPGRTLLNRVWQATVGRVTLYLLDSNDPLNSPWDRGITANLYAAGKEIRLLQEMILGFGGWRLLEELGLETQVCHLNEGHAAFAVLARAMGLARQRHLTPSIAFWAGRSGNVFTTHTPVAAGFDEFDPALLTKYIQLILEQAAWPLEQVLALGRQDPHDLKESFKMAYLAIRGCGFVNGVSRLHQEVSRGLFRELFPRWPTQEIPIAGITNGVHHPTWHSQLARDTWIGRVDRAFLPDLCLASEKVLQKSEPAEIWRYRSAARRMLVDYVRRRLATQLQVRGADAEAIRHVRHTLDPNALTIGFARRFTGYKRPTLLLSDLKRLERLVSNPARPVQFIIAGKAHPNDTMGKEMVQALAHQSSQVPWNSRIVFLEDYDMALAKHLVGGVDVWLNTPRRLYEACGTSGMKTLFNGGLNLSTLDGWWDEAYTPEVGWTVAGREEQSEGTDIRDAASLYDVLEFQVIPEFYNRDSDGVPRAWTSRVLASMTRLSPQFCSNRMVRDYVQQAYLPATAAYFDRLADHERKARELDTWSRHLGENFEGLRFGEIAVARHENAWRIEAQVYLNDMLPKAIRIELFAEDAAAGAPRVIPMECEGEIIGAVNGWRYTADAPADLPAEHYVPRIVPFHPHARVPLEANQILWQR